jgi:hypothetical protein
LKCDRAEIATKVAVFQEAAESRSGHSLLYPAILKHGRIVGTATRRTFNILFNNDISANCFAHQARFRPNPAKSGQAPELSPAACPGGGTNPVPHLKPFKFIQPTVGRE